MSQNYLNSVYRMQKLCNSERFHLLWNPPKACNRPGTFKDQEERVQGELENSHRAIMGWPGHSATGRDLHTSFFYGYLCRFFRDPLSSISGWLQFSWHFSGLSLSPSFASRNTATLQLLSAEARWPLLVALLGSSRYSFLWMAHIWFTGNYSCVFCPPKGQNPLSLLFSLPSSSR